MTDITTIGGTLLASSQNNADLIVNPNEALLTTYATGVTAPFTETSSTGTLTLNQTQMSPSIWNFNGSPSTTVVVTLATVPFANRQIQNNKGKSITFTYGSGSTVTVPTGNSFIYGDGVNIYVAKSTLGGDLTKVITASTTLTYVEANLEPWIFTGSLGAGATITIPTYTFQKALSNQTGQILTFGYATGATVTVANNTQSLLMGGGVNVYKLV